MNAIAINQATLESTATTEALRLCSSAGIEGFAPWRHQYVDGDVATTRRALDDHGMHATSLCRAGFFTGPASQARHADNLKAVDEAAALGAPVLVLVCGPRTPHADVSVDEAAIADGIERLLPRARELGVTLAIEPFHPMMAADRSAVVTISQALRIARTVFGGTLEPGDGLGIAVDTYHVWWDPELDESLRQASGLVASLQVGDWVRPATDLTQARGLPGSGHIDLGGVISATIAHGYGGPLEVEVLNPAVWQQDPAKVIREIKVWHDLTTSAQGAPEADAAAAAPRTEGQGSR